MRNHSILVAGAFAVLFLGLAAPPARAQEFRGNILGRVVDPSGAAVPGASVTVVNEKTNASSSAVSQLDGAFSVSFLNPGRYRVEVRLAGFNAFVQSGVNVAVTQSVTVNVSLKVGDVSETVTVAAEVPALDKATGSLGQVIDRETLESTPLNGRMIYALLQLAAGVDWDPDIGGGGAGGSTGLKPFDNIVGSSWSINGGRTARNEFLIDGAPASTRGQFNFSPPVDAIEEFRVQTNTYDAQYGRTGGGVINMSLKTGTNRFEGQAWEFMRRTGWDANYSANKSSNPPQPRPLHSENQWGAHLRGPLVKDKTFFALTYEGLHQRSPNPDFVTVPTLAERRGDFSQSYVDQLTPRLIYDPLTTRLDPVIGRYVRDPFPGIIIPAGRIYRIAAWILALYPSPTDPTRRSDNYYNPDNATRQDYHAEVLRIDHQINPTNKAFLTLFHNIRDLHRSSNTLQGTFANRGEWPETRHNVGGALDAVRTLSSSSVLNLRLGFSRFTQSFFQSDVHEFDRNTLGFTDLPGEFLPVFVIDNIETIGVEGEGKTSVDNTASVQANLTRIFGHHTLKVGGEYRNIRSNPSDSGLANGRFHFNDTFTRADPNNASQSGSSVATLLLGYPVNSNQNNTQIGGAQAQSLQWHYPALFIQDNVRVTPKLTVNLGLRWDYESPVTERYNRTNRGFAFDQPSVLADQVRNAPGASGCPACANLKGGLLFAGEGGQPRGLFDPDRNNFQPRVGFAYVLTNETVVRGGFGIYYAPTSQRGDPTSFVSNTTYVANDRSGRVGIPELQYNTLANPYPQGLLPATGASLGMASLLGQRIGIDNTDSVTPSFRQWNFGIARQLGATVVVEATYVGSRSYDVNVSRNFNAVPAEALARGTAYLQERVPNPFAGLLPQNAAKNAATIQRQELLRPYPQYNNVDVNSLPLGRTWYQALQVRVEKRASKGLYFLSSYTLAKGEQAVNFLNDQDTLPVRELADRDRRHRWVLSGRYDLPFGQGRRFFGNARGVLDRVIGGWQVNLVYTMQSGVALQLPQDAGNRLIPLASARLENPTRDRWFNTCYLDNNGVPQRCLAGETPVWQQRQANTLRVTPRNFPDVHAPQKPFYADGSLFKEFRVKGTRLQYRLEAFNLFNSFFPQRPNTDFTSNNFGRITSQSSRQQPRQLQMSLKAYF